MTKEEIFAEATSVYDSYVEALETETFEALRPTPGSNGRRTSMFGRHSWWRATRKARSARL
jgi:hypothetical protein